MNVPQVLLGKSFGYDGLRIVEEEVRSGGARSHIAERVCRRLEWRSPGGAYQLMSARVGLLRLHRAGLITLPAARNGNGNGKPPTQRISVDIDEISVELRADRIPGFFVKQITEESFSCLFNGLMEKHHYLGYTAMAGAQIRYLVGWAKGWLGAISFGASAWAVASRDRYIGWNPSQRQQGLHLILNNSRFLILPWVKCPNLASRILGVCAARLPADFKAIYGYTPVLLETFVEKNRFTGSCYRAANWQCVGETQGRGKKSQRGQAPEPVKTVWVYPLHRNFRQILQGVTR